MIDLCVIYLDNCVPINFETPVDSQRQRTLVIISLLQITPISAYHDCFVFRKITSFTAVLLLVVTDK
jgi:hypothetical protein